MKDMSEEKILVVEDDEAYRFMVAELLRKKGFQVKDVGDGKAAFVELSFSQYDLVVSDIKMPKMTGLDLLIESKKKYPQMPFILMTGFSHIIETHEAFELGADDFISKPFSVSDFLKLIYRHCEPRSKTEEKIDRSADFFGVHVDEFISSTKLLYDVYIKLNNFKYVKVAVVDDVLDSSVIAAYKERGIEYLYIGKEDYRLYLGFNMEVYKAVEDSGRFNKDVHAHLISNISSMFNEMLFEKQLDDSLSGDLKDFCVKGYGLISDHDNLMSILNSIHDISTDETSHATSVAFISSAIAKKLNWHSKGTAYKLYLAAILHDVGKKNLPRELLAKSVSIMTRDEFAKYKEHVNIGKDILIEQRSIPSDVVKAVYEHHEYYNGTGFPNGLKREFIHPFARVIRIADDFCRYL